MIVITPTYETTHDVSEYLDRIDSMRDVLTGRSLGREEYQRRYGSAILQTPHGPILRPSLRSLKGF